MHEENVNKRNQITIWYIDTPTLLLPLKFLPTKAYLSSASRWLLPKSCKVISLPLALISELKGMQAKIDICDNEETTEHIYMGGGLLLSHNDYPWEYEASDLVAGMNPARVCKKELWAKDGNKLVVAIHGNHADLAEGDSLMVRTENNILMDYSNIAPVYEKTVQFEFTVSRGSNGGKGFIVCFKGTLVSMV